MTPVLEICGLGFRFETRTVLRDITFQIQPGESVGLVGANGSGKSTLLWCIAGLLRGSGEVRLFGARPSKATMRRIGMVFQNPEDQLFMPTLLQDLALPLVNQGAKPEDAQAAARDWLQQFGLGGRIANPASHLSLGQRKRAAVALAMIRKPEFLILDEPTAELDGRAARQLARLLNDLTVAKLIASHHLDFLRATTSRLILLNNGEVRAEGTTDSILGDSALLEESGLI
ncbi:MAG: ABC transporter ATP-binding protein [Bryobacterales bacterium]|nr:ABC transporter ATP-binding protein [Bryobacterales bacterium]